MRPIISDVKRDIKSGMNWTSIIRKSIPDRFEYKWGDPILLANPEPIDFLLRPFCRLKFFLPDRQMCHQLPDGKMPCPWHGSASSCVIRNAVFNPNCPRLIHDEDGTRIYLFSGRFICNINRDIHTEAIKRSNNNDTFEGNDQDESEDNAYK